MKKLLPFVFGVLFAGFILLVAAAVLYYSWNALSIIFPNDLLGQSFGITLFDIAAFVWFGVMIYKSRSTMQYVWSFIGFIIGLVGALGLIAIEIGLNSGIYLIEDIQKPLTYIFVAVLFVHLVLIYVHHMSAPEVSADISLGIEKAKITDEAQKLAEKQLKENLPMLASSIANDLVKRVMQDLNLIPSSNQVLDLPALDVKDSSTENNQGGAPNFLWKMLNGMGIGERKFGFDAQNVDLNLTRPTPKPSPAQPDAGKDVADGDEPKV